MREPIKWLQIRDNVLARDNNKCRSCNRPDDLRVHHIIQKAIGGTDELDNLVTLCNNCHKKHHHDSGILRQPGQRTQILSDNAFITKVLRGGKVGIPLEVRKILKIEDGKQVEATVRLIEEGDI